jgi:hypothetical protein
MQMLPVREGSAPLPLEQPMTVLHASRAISSATAEDHIAQNVWMMDTIAVATRLN